MNEHDYLLHDVRDAVRALDALVSALAMALADLAEVKLGVEEVLARLGDAARALER